MVSSKRKAYFEYGKVEVRAKLPVGDFFWPAIWMLPQDNAYGTWAASGEIDIMEARGQVSDHVSHVSKKVLSLLCFILLAELESKEILIIITVFPSSY